MANFTRPELRQARLKRWAEADYEDEQSIAKARKRIRLREIDRLSTEDDSESDIGRPASNASYRDREADVQGSIKQEELDGEEVAANDDHLSDFERLLQRFKDACDHLDVADALDCAVCEQYPPDDPIMTSCLCIYCTECFTELLAKIGKVGTPPSIQCVAYGEEKIEGYTALSAIEWEALFGIFKDHTLTPDEYFPSIHETPDDIERLWTRCQSENAIDQGEGDHSRTSPELGDENGAGEGSPALASQDELSSDGFDGESRSDRYESDFDYFPEAAENPGLISQSGYVVDPRHTLADLSSTSDPTSSSGETNNSFFHEVTMSEIDNLVAEVPNWATLDEPVLIDLIEGGDGGDNGNGNAHATGESKKQDGNDKDEDGGRRYL